MTGPDPAVAAVRRAARQHLGDVTPGALILVALSGGPDSLALLAGACFEARKAAVRVGAVVVDHGLQPGSAEVADAAGRAAVGLGADPVLVRRASNARGERASNARGERASNARGERASNARGERASGVGPEAAARAARYAVLERAAEELGASAVWLGHTLDDQAEQVLLGLARGSGTRSLAGMPKRRPPYERPLLALPKSTTRAACRALGLQPWEDPSNADPSYLRNRVRRALADLEVDLGPGLAAALARTADLARADADALDELADQARRRLGPAPHAAADLLAHPPAVRGRLWRLLAREAGAGALTSAHVRALEALLTDWHGQGPADLPGGVRAQRREGTIRFAPLSGRASERHGGQ